MTLIKFKPAFTKDLFRDAIVPSQMLSMFDSMFNEGMNKLEKGNFFNPKVDVLEHPSKFELQICAPGMAKEEISIELNDDVLTISGERKMQTENKEATYHAVESYYGKFSRSFTLSENIDKKKIEANLENGILYIHLYKNINKKNNKSSITIK
jgi:HSP20 family protein